MFIYTWNNNNSPSNQSNDEAHWVVGIGNGIASTTLTTTHTKDNVNYYFNEITAKI